MSYASLSLVLSEFVSYNKIIKHKMVLKFFNAFFSVRNAKEYKGLTDFLVSNPAFVHMAKTFHEKNKKAVSSMEDYLDKEILGETKPKPETPKKVHTKKRSSSYQDPRTKL